jgi:hypothetical protein
MKKDVKILTMLLAALLVVGLLLATACTNPTNGEPGAPGTPGKDGAAGKDGADGTDGGDGEDGINGSPGTGTGGGGTETTLTGSVSVASMEALYKVVNKVTWVTGVTVAAGTYEIPSGKTLVVVGDVALGSGNIIINAYNGSLNLSGGTITGDGAGDVILLNAQIDSATKANIKGTASIPELVTTIDAAVPPKGVMVSSLPIGGSGEITAANFNTYATGGRVYVIDDLTITGDAALTNAQVTVFGDTTTDGDLTLTTNTILRGKLTVTDDKVITGLNFFTNTLDIGTHAVEGTGAVINLARLDADTATPGTLELSGTLTTVSIGGGNGQITVSGTPGFTGGGVFGNSGLTTFETAVTVATAPITFTGPVSFENTLTITAVNATFNSTADFTGAVSTGAGAAVFGGAATFDGALTTGGAVTFNSTADITGVATLGGEAIFDGDATFGNTLAIPVAGATFGGTAVFDGAVTTAGPITFGDTAAFGDVALTMSSVNAITLNAGVSLAANDETIITASPDGIVTLTPGAGALLTFNEAGSSVTQTGGAVAIGGDAILAEGATYTASAVALTVNAGGSLTVDTDAKVAFATTGSLVLTGHATTGALLKGAGTVVVGGAAIAGGTNGWQAVGAANVSITTTTGITIGGGTVLKGLSTNSAITVPASSKLTVTTGQIDLSTAGSVILGGHTAPGTAGAIILAGAGANAGNLLVDGDIDDAITIGTADASNFTLNYDTNTGFVTMIDVSTPATNGNIVLEGDGNSAATGTPLGNIGGGTANAAYIRGPNTIGQNLEIKNGVTVTVPAT